MPRRFYLLLTLTTLAGAFLRLWQLNSVPPGLHYDLAATALLGNEVAFNGFRPIFITAFTGHEALFYYWLAGWFQLIGSSVFTLRLAAAMLGILALPATFFAVRQAVRFEEQSLSIAAFATAYLAFAFFHVTFSRFGFRVITEPVVQALALGFLLRGLRQTQTGRWARDMSLAGFFTGLAAYTYLAARLFPFPLAIFWIALFFNTTRKSWTLLSFGVFLLAAALTFAPLGIYFFQHPADFFNRAGQIVPRAGEGELLLTGIRRAAEMIFWDGEPYDRFNLPGLSLLGPVLGFFFVIGGLLTVRDLVMIPAQRPLTLLLLTWMPLMLVPTALSVHDIFPSNVRAFGLIPLLFVFPARGLLASYRWVQQQWPGPLIPSAYPVTILCLITLAAGTLNTYRDYFVVWANLPNQRLNNDADLTLIANYLNTRDLTYTNAYVSAIHFQHPTLAYLARDFSALRWLTGGTSLALPADRAALYLFARSAPPPEEWIEQWGDHLVAAPVGAGNHPDFRAYEFAAGETPPLPEFIPLTENFGNLATLTGYRLFTETKQVRVDLRWQIENLSEIDDLLPYVRLYDEQGEWWAQNEGFTYPSGQWQVGDTLLVRLSVPLPVGLPPGNYTLKAGLYSEGRDFNVMHLDARGAYAGPRARLADVFISGGPPATAADLIAVNAPLSPQRNTGLEGDLQLLGYQLSPNPARQGEWIDLTLYWNARTRLTARNLTVRLGGRDWYVGAPARNTLPFDQWLPGQLVIDRYALKVPLDQDARPAEVSVEVPGYGAATLTTLNVQETPRRFEGLSDSATPTEIVFAQKIVLRGYELQAATPTHLALYWQALAEMPTNYTAFVHVLDATGQIVAQSDSQPQGGSYPTSIWAAQEIVVEPYTFDLPPGEYELEVGWYVAETGERLGEAARLGKFSVP